MKAIIIVTPQNNKEYRFITDLLQRLGVDASAITSEVWEDRGMAKLLRKVDKSKKASRAEVMKKLSA